MSRLSLAAPLPECALCERPTRRAVWDATGGLCRSCRDGLGGAASSGLVPPPDVALVDRDDYWQESL